MSWEFKDLAMYAEIGKAAWKKASLSSPLWSLLHRSLIPRD